MWSEESDGDGRPLNAAGVKARAAAWRRQLEQEGVALSPVLPHGKGVARSFWGRAWCRNIEQYQDYESRLPLGRSYLKNETVLDLRVLPGRVEALVGGSELYHIAIDIDPVTPERRAAILARCAGGIASLVDLLEGNLSEAILTFLCDPDEGLFPAPAEIRLSCDCPDWSDVCKHLAAVLYGIGARLDDDPGLFFLLRGVDQSAFFAGAVPAVPGIAAAASGETMLGDSGDLADIFGIELD